MLVRRAEAEVVAVEAVVVEAVHRSRWDKQRTS
jgi:hypothetical protein